MISFWKLMDTDLWQFSTILFTIIQNIYNINYIKIIKSICLSIIVINLWLNVVQKLRVQLLFILYNIWSISQLLCVNTCIYKWSTCQRPVKYVAHLVAATSTHPHIAVPVTEVPLLIPSVKFNPISTIVALVSYCSHFSSRSPLSVGVVGVAVLSLSLAPNAECPHPWPAYGHKWRMNESRWLHSRLVLNTVVISLLGVVCGYCSGNVRVCYNTYYVLFKFTVNMIWPGST